MAKVLTPRSESYAQWYNDLVIKAGLAEHSAVRGCMVIKPYGFAIWEKMQRTLDDMFKETGHQNAYFPLFIPKSFFSKEADHVEGFAKECAVVTHYRLKNSDDGKGIEVDPEARLEEEYVVRPTSETIIWNTYKDWIQSYRDLPLLINQWANVVRWEMRTRLFLRTAEFLWQEGHTAHATKEEAIKESETMLKVYADFAENWMAMPVLQGYKTASERFAGAVETLTIEALMQDGRALQSGTSHFLGQNFAKVFDVKFASKEGNEEYVWATSWGVSTRLMGALIMSHSDDNGLVLPPKLAPIQVVIVPIYKKEEQLASIVEKGDEIAAGLKKLGISVKVDDDDQHKPGWKFSQYELQGVPLRIAIGPRDMENSTVELARRDTLTKEVVPMEGIEEHVRGLLEEIQQSIYQRALDFREENTHTADSYEEFKHILDEKG
ncbi:MAG: proline--tRNA ligase, partial [Marinilabiliaceae bacterium]